MCGNLGHVWTIRLARLLATCLAFPLSAAAAPWPIPDAITQTRIVKRADSPWPASTAVARLWPENTNTAFRVLTAAGQPVGSRVLWAAEGEPTKLLFDSSSSATEYDVYESDTPASDLPAWKPTAGLILETRTRRGTAVETWDNTYTLWTNSRPVLGRSLVPAIHLGSHPHGPISGFAAYFHGFLEVPTPGTYALATISDDASFLLVNGKQVAAWPGQHSVAAGQRGEFAGTVELTAGCHQVEYYNMQFGDSFSVSAAWKRPGQPHFEIIPPSAFPPAAEFEATGCVFRPGHEKPARLAWEVRAHTMAGKGNALITVALRVLSNGADATCEWSFDDGAKATGPEVEHVFLSPGPRRVEINVRPETGPAFRIARIIRAHPLWTQLNQWPHEVFEKQRADLMARELRGVPLPDLLNVWRIAQAISDRPLLSAVGRAALNRRAELTGDQAYDLAELADHFAHPDVRQYAQAREAFEAAIALSPKPAFAERVKVSLAGLLTDVYGEPEIGLRMLKSVDELTFPGETCRRNRLYQGDALLDLGKIDAARDVYAAVGVLERDASQGPVRRRARLEAARDFLLRKEYDAAARLIHEIEWQNPQERLDTETGLLMVQVHAGRGEHSLALTRCQRLLTIAPAGPVAPEALYWLTEIQIALGDTENAQRAFDKLVKDYRYDEAAARATERWGAGGPVAEKEERK